MGIKHVRVRHDRTTRQDKLSLFAAILAVKNERSRQLVYRTKLAGPRTIEAEIIAPIAHHAYGTTAYGSNRLSAVEKLKTRLNNDYGFIGRLVHESDSKSVKESENTNALADGAEALLDQ